MREVLFLKPVLKEMIWGGERLKTEFLYDIPSNHTGECWAVSAHPNGDCEIINKTYAGKTLSELWELHQELFGHVRGAVFPLLVKIIDAKADLSIQVHPNDAYAKEKEQNALGKTECWYILDCEEGATIVIGHHAKDSKQLEDMIRENEWDQLLRTLPIRKGDFFQIEPGTVHAIKAGTLILETQQNSDITYRLYDYGRLQEGKPRELHIEKSKDVISCPQEDIVALSGDTTARDSGVTQLVACEYYTVSIVEVVGEQTLAQEGPFTIVSVVEGEGKLDSNFIKKGDHFILPFGYGESQLSGQMQLIISHV